MSLNLGVAHASIELRLDRLEAQLARATREFDSAGKKIEGRAKKLNADLAQSFGSLGRSLTIGLTAPLAALGTAAIKSAVDMDSLKRGLRAVSGSSQEAERQLVRLKEVAKLPGLGFREAIQGSINLQAAGLSAREAERSLKGFGNALATVGKGKAELDGVTLALTQIAAKGKVSAEEINQLQERVPQIRQILKDAFGTADTEILQKAKISTKEFFSVVNDALERLPKVAGGAKNAFENFSDASQQALAKLGDAFLPTIVKGLESVTPVLERLGEGFKRLGPTVQTALGGLAVGGAIIGPAMLGISALAGAVKNLDKVFVGSAFWQFAKRFIGGGAIGAAGPVALSGFLSATVGSLYERNGMNERTRTIANLERAQNRPAEDMRRIQELQRQIAQHNRNQRQSWFQSMPREDRLRSAAQNKERLDEMRSLMGEARGPVSPAQVRINAAARAEAMAKDKSAAKEAAAEAKRFAKEQAEARKQFEVDMAAFRNKFGGQRVQAEQDFREKIPTLGIANASKWLKEQLAVIQKAEDEERKALNDAHKRKIDDARKRSIQLSVAAAERARELQKAELAYSETMRQQAEAIEKGRINALGQHLKSLYDRVRNELDQFTSQMLDSQREAQTSLEAMFPPGAPIGMSKRMPAVPFDNPLARPETPNEYKDRIARVENQLRRSLGGHLGTEIAYGFVDSFAQGLEKAFGNSSIGRIFARGLSRWLDKEVGNMMDNLFSSLAKGKKGGIGGIAGPSGIGGLLGSFAPILGIGAAIGGLFKGLKFADGGWVPGPIGAPQPAVVHGGEFVMSRKMLESGGGGGSINIANVNVASDYDVDRFFDRLAWHTKGRQANNPGTF